jgi:hypothetical protein
MAVITPEIDNGIDKYMTIKWEELALNDSGTVISIGQYDVQSIHITGTLGGTIPIIQGSMDGTNFEVLSFNGFGIIATTGMFNIFEFPKFIAPFCFGGDGTTDIDFIVGAVRLVD